MVGVGWRGLLLASMAEQGKERAGEPLEVLDWGRVGYVEALQRQGEWVERRLRGEVGDILIFTEHDPVYTVGRRIGAERHLLLGEEELRTRGIGVVRTTRGGDITYHGPGQVVGYPILSLEKSRDLHVYLRALESVLIRSVGHYGVKAERREGWTGIWVGRRKIAAIGVAVRRWVSFHGFALNVDVDLAAYNGIVPCGIPANEGEVTSLCAELGAAVDIVSLKERLTVEFRREFGHSAGHGNQAKAVMAAGQAPDQSELP